MGHARILTTLLGGACCAMALTGTPATAGGFNDAAVEEGRKLDLSGGAILTTDYIFRGLSFSDTNPSVQAYFTASYGIFYAGAWALSSDFQAFDDPSDFTQTSTVAFEIDYYAGIAPSWNGWNFDFSVLYYTFPGADDGALETDYLELHTHVAREIVKNVTGQIGFNWSPDWSFETGPAFVIEGKLDWTLPKFGRFTPTLGGLVGYTWWEDSVADGGLADYTYWNAGLNLAFHENWSVDVRYWDTDLSRADCAINAGRIELCDERVVGTLAVTF